MKSAESTPNPAAKAPKRHLSGQIFTNLLAPIAWDDWRLLIPVGFSAAC
ncbi:MAG: hypothetical protein ACOY37_13425 [Pseudomonadota bacterium]